MPLGELIPRSGSEVFLKKKESKEIGQQSDVVVIGGGIIGSTIAYELAKHGSTVTVIEKNQQPGLEASSGAFGTLSPRSYATMPPEHYDLLKESIDMYSEWVSEISDVSGENLVMEKKMRIQAALSESDLEELNALYHSAQEKGIRAEYITPKEMQELEPNITPHSISGLLLPDDAQINDMVRLTKATAIAAEAKGANFVTNTPVSEIVYENDRVVGVRSGDTIYRADKVVLAAGSWSGGIKGGMQLPIIPQRGQGIMVDNLGLLNNIIISSNSYIAPRRDGKIILGIVEEQVGFKSNPTVGGVQEILTGAIDLVPALKDAPIVRVWAGMRPFTPDALPIMGSPRDYPNLVFATGHHYGMILAPITAKLISKFILSIENINAKLAPFSPDRFAK